MNEDPRAFLIRIFEAAIASAQPEVVVGRFLPEPPEGRTLVIGAGKASAAMARALESHWSASLSGVVVTRYGYSVTCDRIDILEAAHPVPDAAGLAASERILECARSAQAGDLVICLISGGGSALMPLPLPGLTLEDKQSVSRALLKSGASISEMNCVRRHLSAIKGGRLAAACHPARLVNLLISDVPGDNPIDIASGPGVPDPTTCRDALEIIARYAIDVPKPVRVTLENGDGESLKPGDPRLPEIDTRLIATPRKALQEAAEVARAAGVTPVLLGDDIESEARDLGKVMAAISRELARRDGFVKPPCLLLSGGETTVTVRGSGRGGRNVEFLLSMAIALRGQPNVYAIAGDTDGVDGQEEIAGACLAPDTLQRAWALGINPQSSLDDNDGHGFFESLGDSVVTGPTLTNVNDFRAVLVT